MDDEELLEIAENFAQRIENFILNLNLSHVEEYGQKFKELI